MKRILMAMAVACLAASPALAQHHDDKGGNRGGNAHQTSHQTSHQTRSANVHRNNFTGGGKTSHTVRTRHVNVIRGGHEHHRTVTHRTVTVHRNAMTHRGTADVRSYRRNVTSAHRFHNGSYRRPSGWYSHRWVYGEHLPRAWFGRDYWIGDYITFGLMAPPDGYEWVRVGDDALLVDTDTGEVLQVEYGVFY
jgi:Ni/Co efflux regulator RcnB